MKILNISQTELNELINYSNDEIIKIENINLSGLYFKIPCKPIQIEGCIMQSTLMPQGNLCGYFRLTNCDLSNAKFPKTYYANNGSLCINNCTFDEDTQFPELIVGGDFRVQKMDLSNFDIPSVKDGKAEIYKCNFSPQTRFVGNSIADVAIVECNIDNLNMPAELNSLTLTECTHQAGFKMPETLGSLSISYCHLKNIDISSIKEQLVIGEGCKIENSIFPQRVLILQTHDTAILTNISYR